jgi:hypothetical protein
MVSVDNDPVRPSLYWHCLQTRRRVIGRPAQHETQPERRRLQAARFSCRPLLLTELRRPDVLGSQAARRWHLGH